MLREEIVTTEEQHDLDNLGIAKNAREEKMRARDANAKARGAQKNDAAYDARMAALYREVVLKEKPAVSEGGFIPLDSLSKPNGNGNGLHGIAPHQHLPLSRKLASRSRETRAHFAIG